MALVPACVCLEQDIGFLPPVSFGRPSLRRGMVPPPSCSITARGSIVTAGSVYSSPVVCVLFTAHQWCVSPWLYFSYSHASNTF